MRAPSKKKSISSNEPVLNEIIVKTEKFKLLTTTFDELVNKRNQQYSEILHSLQEETGYY